MWGKNKNVDETESADKKFQKELVSGVAALVLLTILDKAAEPMYGYQIAKVIDGQAEDATVLKQGALYPVLRSLESSRLLESRVEPSVSGPSPAILPGHGVGPRYPGALAGDVEPDEEFRRHRDGRRGQWSRVLTST